MSRKKEKKRTKTDLFQEKGKKQTNVLIFSILLLVVGLVAFGSGLFQIYQSRATELVVYSVTKPCKAYDQNGELAAWVNVTMTTNVSVPQPSIPVNITLQVRGIYVPSGNWTYAYLEGATAAFPNKEPHDWNHEVKSVIVLKQLNEYSFDYIGSRIMNYTYGGTWNIYIQVVSDTIFIVNNIPPNPTNLPMAIYTVPNAVDIASAEYIAQMKASEESTKTTAFWSGIALVVAGLSSIITTIITYYQYKYR